MTVTKNLLIYKATDISLIISLILVPSLFFIPDALAQSSADCPAGFGLDPDPGGGCVPLPPGEQQPDPVQNSVECPTDQVLDSNGNCVPEVQLGADIQESLVECPTDQVLDSNGNCVPEVQLGADIQESLVAPIVKEATKTGEVIGGRLGEIEKAVVGDNPTLGSEIGLLSLAGIISAIGAIVIAVYKVKHRNRKSKSYPSSVNVDVITHGGIEE
jgi:hypothetical protein